ncbi:MAG TPA: 2-oxo acid dehydrogenase subunit E2 [Candidatus Avamphibacillus intestinigallinarum]|nr:2-oxo acid dehydrogenase subunit E2 [Candidatus Avamphibacillus intestinigallinarum]
MAREEITMPKLGESVVEGTINTWLIAEGDHVNKYDPIAEVTTDKVNAEIPSSFTGTITDIVVNEGETVEIDTLICYIETEESDQTEETVEPAEQTTNEASHKETDVSSMKKRYSPAVLRLAQEHQINLEQLVGTGKFGRITRKDVEQAIQHGVPEVSTEPSTTPAPSSKIENRSAQTQQRTSTGDIEIPVTGVRKVVAEHMVQAKQEIPHAWMMVEVDVTDLVNYRDSLKKQFKEREGYNLTYFAFFAKAVAQALKEFPEMNSVWAGDKIIQRKDVHLSFAVAKEQDLFVPVIQHADEKTVKGIAREIHLLSEKARNGKLTTADIEGGTFTVNNTGSFGSVQSMGIINHPQAAILQVESIVKKPVIINDMFAARHMVNLCLSLDHRILDGLICGRFMARVKEILENVNEETANVF